MYYNRRMNVSHQGVELGAGRDESRRGQRRCRTSVARAIRVAALRTRQLIVKGTLSATIVSIASPGSVALEEAAVFLVSYVHIYFERWVSTRAHSAHGEAYRSL